MAALSLWDGMFTSAEEARARGNELYRNGAIDDGMRIESLYSRRSR